MIALVITIIVLLILAGVSIAMLTGENGILTQAQTAKEETEKSSLIEQVQVDILGEQAKGNGSGIDAGTLQTILNKYFTNVPTDANSITIDLVLKANENYGGYDIPLSDIYNGEINIKGITAGDLTDEQKKELYGSYVTNYECSSNDAIETSAPGKWMIFHIDDDNIYLIASDYITQVPAGKGGNTPSIGSGSYPRGVSFSNILNGYLNGSADVSDIGRELNSSYFNYLTTNNISSTDSNINSVAYMLDTDAWSGFKGTDADYAIGGPTVELLFESYNKKYGTNYLAQATKSTGYLVGSGSASLHSLNLSTTNDPTYVINSSSNALGMWLASPSAFNSSNVMLVNSSGTVSSSTYGNANRGFRPLVSLRSDVQLKKTGDNTYEIIK